MKSLGARPDGKDQRFADAKKFLVIASIVAGLTVFMCLTCQTYPTEPATLRKDRLGLGFLLMISTCFLYPVLGAFAVGLIEATRAWAYSGSQDEWTRAHRLMLAAVWPFSFLVGMILYPCLGLIHRLFD